MTEPVKKTNTSAWMTALKQYNEGKQWCVPKKDTPEYLAVKEIADKIKAEKGGSAPPRPKGEKTKVETGPSGITNPTPAIPTNPNGPTEIIVKKTRKRKVKEPVE